MILMADTFLVSMFVASKHFANPPFPKNLPFEYFLTEAPPPILFSFSSMISVYYG